MQFNFDSFSHGQIVSKIWLCEHLEPFLPENATVAILGSWYNVLSFMMLTRKQDAYQYILGIDIDDSVSDIADKINNAWTFESKVQNITGDARTYDYSNFDIVINCSSEHMGSEWFSQISTGTIVCIQTSNVIDTEYPWLVSNPSSSLHEFIEKYPLNQILFSGEKEITYPDWGYSRYMLIGIK